MLGQYLLYNGALHPASDVHISPNNRAFRYGDGFFETMKMVNGNVILESLHLERLFHSLQVLQFSQPAYFTPAYIHQQLQELTTQNNHRQLARVRLMVFRGDGNLYDIEDDQPNYLIQSWPLQEFPAYNEEGVIAGIYKEARKTADAFSAIKSNNYLPYAMAAIWSKKRGLDDALIMNCYSRIAEASTSNIFIVKDGIVLTPPLSEGCINGVVRRYLLQYMRDCNVLYAEQPLTPGDVLGAEEVFLTNAGFYIRYVKQCGEKRYSNKRSKQLFNNAITPLFSQYK